MCNGLVVREITSPKSANALSAAARTVSANLPGARVAREFPAGVSGRYLPYFGTRLPDQYSTIHQWKSRPRTPLGNSIERALATKQNQTKSFESQVHRRPAGDFSGFDDRADVSVNGSFAETHRIDYSRREPIAGARLFTGKRIV